MTRSVRRLALALLVALAPGVGAMAETIVLKADRYLDVGAGRMVEPAVIVVRDGIIAAINPAVVPEADQAIELPGMTLLPGLMDAHTHITADVSRGWQYAAVRRTAADYALVGAVNAARTLQAGFTTVRDLGAAHFADIAVAQAIESGLIPGPEIIAAGHGLGITGGHCDVTGFAPGVLETDWHYGVADGADEVAKALRYQVKHGARVVKLCATAGVMSHEASVGAQQLDAAELAAAVAEAGRHGLKVAAHAVGTEGIIAAAQAGVDSIEHASMLTPAAARLIRERGTDLVFTLYLYEAIDPAMLPPAMLAKGMAIRDVSRQSFQLAVQENLRIVFGTDAGVYPHGDNAREFATRVRLGQSPLEAIRSATLYASELLGVPDRGQLREGLRADLIAVPGDPLARIEALQSVGFVMKAGRIHRQP
ncbi:MAG: amidohydrolase family protein [Gammaproteobacteria bacterium]|nr:MAG: amidohydrolase family protein [Gammaproteobacteria bacterium]